MSTKFCIFLLLCCVGSAAASGLAWITGAKQPKKGYEFWDVKVGFSTTPPTTVDSFKSNIKTIMHTYLKTEFLSLPNPTDNVEIYFVGNFTDTPVSPEYKSNSATLRRRLVSNNQQVYIHLYVQAKCGENNTLYEDKIEKVFGKPGDPSNVGTLKAGMNPLVVSGTVDYAQSVSTSLDPSCSLEQVFNALEGLLTAAAGLTGVILYAIIGGGVLSVICTGGLIYCCCCKKKQQVVIVQQ